jgi:predicted AAA+ superfamily ATPase
VSLVPRSALVRLERLAKAFRVVIVNGPRQSGKTTLVRLLLKSVGGSFRTLDEEGPREAAVADPRAFVEFGDSPRIIDEVQRGGDPLILAIKYQVDRDNSRGQFVLSGSTRFLTVPTLSVSARSERSEPRSANIGGGSESLAGRAGFVDVWPFAMTERTGVIDDLGDTLVDTPADLAQAGSSTWQRADYLNLICLGGFPEAVTMPGLHEQRAWFQAYLRTVIQRDVRQFADMQHAALVPRLLGLVAARAGSTVVFNDVAAAVSLDQKTTRNYLSYLDTVFLTIQVPAWSRNLTTKVAKTARTYISDPGLAANLLGAAPAALAQPGHAALGPLVETFVATELTRLLANQDRGVVLSYFRDRDGREIDFVLESPDGRITGIEVKASSSVRADDFRHLRWLRERVGDRLSAGLVLYLGEHSLPFGDGMFGVPMSALWRHALLPNSRPEQR